MDPKLYFTLLLTWVNILYFWAEQYIFQLMDRIYRYQFKLHSLRCQYRFSLIENVSICSAATQTTCMLPRFIERKWIIFDSSDRFLFRLSDDPGIVVFLYLLLFGYYSVLYFSEYRSLAFTNPEATDCKCHGFNFIEIFVYVASCGQRPLVPEQHSLMNIITWMNSMIDKH